MSRARRDLFANGRVAHSALRGQVEAARFADGVPMRVAAPVADLRLDPDKAGLDRQILQGHPVRLLEPETGFCRDETSGYVGYVSPDALVPWAEPTHRVHAARSLLFTAPDFKHPHPQPVSAGTLFRVTGTEGRFARLDDGRFVPGAHLKAVGTPLADWVAFAETLLGTPYLWGGNSAFGIDCSGLVQIALQAAGLPCPGDSDQQMETVGAQVPIGSEILRGDLLFWKGHVAIALDADRLLHANVHHMAVAVEGRAAAIDRIAAQGDGPVLAHRRPG